jgi:hypothetical protein
MEAHNTLQPDPSLEHEEEKENIFTGGCMMREDGGRRSSLPSVTQVRDIKCVHDDPTIR